MKSQAEVPALVINMYPDFAEALKCAEVVREGVAKTLAPRYYENLNGSVACFKHIGCSAQAHLDTNPNARAFDTDLTRWYRMTTKQVSEFAELVKNHGNGAVCESCRYEGETE